MKKFLTLILCVLALGICSSCKEDKDSDNPLKDLIENSESDITVTFNDKEPSYTTYVLSYMTGSKDNNNCVGYNNRPLYYDYNINLRQVNSDGGISRWVTIDVYDPDFGKGFEFTEENTSLKVLTNGLTDDINFVTFLHASGTAKVKSFDGKSCTTEFKKCVFKSVKKDFKVEINGTLTIPAEVD
ncbi:MAG: hypothetical protein KBT06_05005 [Prevotellaceae bacterium]|nr:hypothetical protein [Candidatus Colivivens equi]